MYRKSLKGVDYVHAMRSVVKVGACHSEATVADNEQATANGKGVLFMQFAHLMNYYCNNGTCHDIPFIRQGNRLYFDRPTIKKWLEKKQNIECITNMEEFEKFMTPDPWCYRNRR